MVWIACRVPTNITESSYQNPMAEKSEIIVELYDGKIFAEALIKLSLDNWNSKIETFEEHFLTKEKEIKDLASKTIEKIFKIGEVSLRKNYQLKKWDSFEFF